MLSDIPLNVRKKIQKLSDTINIRSEIGKTIPILRKIHLNVQIVSSVERVYFYVAEKPATSVKPVFDFCHRHVEAI